MLKKKIIIISIVLLILITSIIFIPKIINYYKIKNAKIEIVLNNDNTLEFNSDKKVSDYITSINGKITDDYKIDSTKLGEKEVKFTFINDDNIKLNYSYKVNVIDTVPPVIWLGKTYNVVKGSDIDLVEKIMCGDNYDDNPNCFIEGEYDLNTEGKYNLVFKAVDNSNNESKQEFTLNVYTPSGSSSNGTKTYTYFKDVVNNYKTDKTKIGLDVSEWQGSIDFEKIKESGVEFLILRVGGTKGRTGDYFLDSEFINNIENANKYGIPVGLYFYSYATSMEKAKENANFVLNQIKDYKVDLPIAFDWEEWSNYNKYNLSFFNLTNMAEEFIKTVEKKGYKGMLYSSKAYLEDIWLKNNNIIWLAHYTKQTDYEGDYMFWQMCSNGRIDGINGDVDIDIMYT